MTSEPKTYYITTPLYYVNAKPHIGHAYTTIAADILRRYKAMRQQPVYLLTGTDEHGSKIEEAAKAAGKTPLAYADEVSETFRELWKHLDIHYNDFIRTTEPRHEVRVQAVFTALLNSKDIYKGKYKGYYCVSCETYWTETDAGEGKKCPTCGKPLQWVEEESYFFALSKYRDRLLDHYKKNPKFLRPAHRANEILRFVEAGLRDLSISRTKVAWGITVPGDAEHTVYVWFDALLNYITAAGYQPPGAKISAEASGEGRKGFKELWPADVHIVGKEIYRFHAVIWPAMLMALNVPLPKTVFAHGWWTVDGEKMSKSKGNFVDPREITREFGIDSFRYFLFREMPFGNDGNFSRESLRKHHNSELSNDLGNLLRRVVALVDQNLNGEMPGRPQEGEASPLAREVEAATAGIYQCMDELEFTEALNRIWAIISKLNQTINKQEPWKMAKTEPQKLKPILFDYVRSLRIIAGWLGPFMPHSAAQMQIQLGVRKSPAPLTAEEVVTGSSESQIHQVPPLFPRK